MMIERKDCRFWSEFKLRRGDGECRRHAPVFMADNCSGWPSVQRDGWCGEAEAKPDDEARP